MANKIRKSIKSKKKHNNTRKLKKKTRKCKTGGGFEGNSTESDPVPKTVMKLSRKPEVSRYVPRGKAREIEAKKLLEIPKTLPVADLIVDSIVEFDKLMDVDTATKNKLSSYIKKNGYSSNKTPKNDAIKYDEISNNIKIQINRQIEYAKNTFRALLENMDHKQILDQIESPVVLVDFINIEYKEKYESTHENLNTQTFSENSTRAFRQSIIKSQISKTKIRKNITFIYIYDDAKQFKDNCDAPYKFTLLDGETNYDLVLNCTTDTVLKDCKSKCFKSKIEFGANKPIQFNESDDYMLILLNIYLRKKGKSIFVYSNDNYSFLRDGSIIDKISEENLKSRSSYNKTGLVSDRENLINSSKKHYEPPGSSKTHHVPHSSSKTHRAPRSFSKTHPATAQT
jgi:hypothetical protein